MPSLSINGSNSYNVSEKFQESLKAKIANDNQLTAQELNDLNSDAFTPAEKDAVVKLRTLQDTPIKPNSISFDKTSTSRTSAVTVGGTAQQVNGNSQVAAAVGFNSTSTTTTGSENDLSIRENRVSGGAFLRAQSGPDTTRENAVGGRVVATFGRGSGGASAADVRAAEASSEAMVNQLLPNLSNPKR